ncbi:ubiquitin-related modifier 1 [Lasiosphaeria hispida]|uniref:Ubiquitin-related modifier 1 n=1 Tax=Lasiosphaeria hispida TaxID=260671 RepID=A0AAJ0MHJ8_9PEZI|nr:ubiquitin-related modifier 1 [Lasiosphaeria hispida]
MADSTEVPIRESETPTISIAVDFYGGLHTLFGKGQHKLAIPAADKSGNPATIGFLVTHLCETKMNDPRTELFVLDGHIRPGILVLINEADWELEGEEAYEIQSGDNIVFVSTLHGG